MNHFLAALFGAAMLFFLSLMSGFIGRLFMEMFLIGWEAGGGFWN